MPMKPPRPCRSPGCPALVRGGTGYCDQHQAEAQRQQDARRGTAAERGYDARWRALRIMFLRRHPLCADPDGVHTGPVPATDVDHIVPKRDGGRDAWDNLQALCHSCHSRKTARELGWTAEGGAGAISTAS